MNERRIARIQELIKARVAEVVDRELKDPRRGMVTITRVEVDRELTACVVYWSVLGDEHERKKNANVLRKAAPFVQREVAAVLHTRTVPRVRFEFDETLAKAQRLEDILRELREQNPDQGDDDPSRGDESPEDRPSPNA